jgi:hypothetical protein
MIAKTIFFAAIYRLSSSTFSVPVPFWVLVESRSPIVARLSILHFTALRTASITSIDPLSSAASVNAAGVLRCCVECIFKEAGPMYGKAFPI